MSGCLRWLFRASVRTSGGKGGWPERRWTSRCAALLRAWTPASVRLETTNLTGTTDFSLSAASCGDRAETTLQQDGLSPAPPGRALLHPRPRAGGAHLQVVLDPDGALGAPDSRDPAVGRGGRRSAGRGRPGPTPRGQHGHAFPVSGPAPDVQVPGTAPALPSSAGRPQWLAPCFPWRRAARWGRRHGGKSGNVLKVGAQVLEVHEVARPHRARAHGWAGSDREVPRRAGAARGRCARAVQRGPSRSRACAGVRPASAARHTRPWPPRAG